MAHPEPDGNAVSVNVNLPLRHGGAETRRACARAQRQRPALHRFV